MDVLYRVDRVANLTKIVECDHFCPEIHDTSLVSLAQHRQKFRQPSRIMSEVQQPNASQASEDRFQSLVTATSMLVWNTNPEGQVVAWAA